MQQPGSSLFLVPQVWIVTTFESDARNRLGGSFCNSSLRTGHHSVHPRDNEGCISSPWEQEHLDLVEALLAPLLHRSPR